MAGCPPYHRQGRSAEPFAAAAAVAATATRSPGCWPWGGHRTGRSGIARRRLHRGSEEEVGRGSRRVLSLAGRQTAGVVGEGAAHLCMCVPPSRPHAPPPGPFPSWTGTDHKRECHSLITAQGASQPPERPPSSTHCCSLGGTQPTPAPGVMGTWRPHAAQLSKPRRLIARLAQQPRLRRRSARPGVGHGAREGLPGSGSGSWRCILGSHVSCRCTRAWGWAGCDKGVGSEAWLVSTVH